MQDDLGAPWDYGNDPLMRGAAEKLHPQGDGWVMNLIIFVATLLLALVVAWGLLSGNRGVLLLLIPAAAYAMWMIFRSFWAAVVVGLIAVITLFFYFLAAFKFFK